MQHGARRKAIQEHIEQRRSRTADAARLLLALLLLAIAAPAARASEAFPRPVQLKHAVEFWKRIFGTYSEHQVVVHDSWYMGKVYEVLDFRSWATDGAPLSGEMLQLRNEKVAAAKEHTRAILLRLH